MREMKDSGIQWIGSIPDHWSISRMKYNLSEPMKYGASETGVDFDSTLYRYIRITDITSDGSLKEEGKLSLPHNQAFGYILSDKTILFARSGGTVGKSFMYRNEYGKSAFAGYLISAVANQNKMLPEWLLYFTNSSAYYEWINQIFTRATIQNIGADKYNNMPIPIAPIIEQKRIVAFLDTKCSEIDSLAADIQAQIDTLEQYKRSVITEAVTKGLEKNVQMKDSGIEWVGKIPDSWRISSISYYSSSRSGGTPDRLIPSYWENGNIPWMASGEVNKVHVYETNEKITELATKNSSAKILPANCVMVALNGQGKTKGMSAILHISAACNQSLCAFRCDEKNLHYSYLFYCFQSMYKYLRYQVGDGLRDGLAASFVKKQRIPLPNFEDQKKIANFLDKKCEEINETVSLKKEQLSVLADYKKSLIYEYVTGKKEVPNE